MMLLTAIALSGIAAFYSVAGLMAIFAAAVIPIAIMGSILEVAKVTVTVWLHEYWQDAKWFMKAYLTSAVMILMLITSMGIFGFLSKAHSDQNLVSGDVLAKLSIYDEKIKIERENINAAKKALQQMDAQVDQMLGRTDTDRGAERAVSIRKQQAKERNELVAEVARAQKEITKLNNDSAPIRAEVRKVEAEVGPIKYIAALLYNDKPDESMLERAVRWVIICIVIVFDPLAIMMLLAATESMTWIKRSRIQRESAPLGAVITEPLDEKITTSDKNQDLGPCPHCGKTLMEAKGIDIFCPDADCEYNLTDDPDTNAFFKRLRELSKYDQAPEIKQSTNEANDGALTQHQLEQVADTAKVYPETHLPIDQPTPIEETEKAAMREWKKNNPDSTIKEQRRLVEIGMLDQPPWFEYLKPQADNQSQAENVRGFGIEFPENANKGDQFLRVDILPTKLYKFNGNKWIEIDKNLSDQYAHDTAYIDHLIAKIATGEYDPELLNDVERDQIAHRLSQTPPAA